MVTKENFTEQLVMKGKQICWQQCEVVKWDGVNTLHLISEWDIPQLKPESAGTWKEDEGRSCFLCVLALIIFYPRNSDEFHITPLTRPQVVNELWPLPWMSTVGVPATNLHTAAMSRQFGRPWCLSESLLFDRFFSPLLQLVERPCKTQQVISQPLAFQMATPPIPTVSGGSRWPQGRR